MQLWYQGRLGITSVESAAVIAIVNFFCCYAKCYQRLQNVAPAKNLGSQPDQRSYVEQNMAYYHYLLLCFAPVVSCCKCTTILLDQGHHFDKGCGFLKLSSTKQLQICQGSFY
jgi:hypothetical protein